MARLFSDLRIPGPDLLLREYGQHAYAILEEGLRGLAPGSALILDFAEVSVMDTSFADESVLELALGLVEGRYGDRFLILQGPSAATIDNLEGTIARRRAKVAMLIRGETGMRVIGHLERNLLEAWEVIHRGDTLTARELADRFGLEINTASMRLHKLYVARLLARREEITPTGRQHAYEIPK